MTDPMIYLEIAATERRRAASSFASQESALSSSSSSSLPSQNKAIASLTAWLPKTPSLQPPRELAGGAMTDAMRSKLARAIITDAAHEDCRWTPADRIVAFRALKELSRLPGSSGAMGSLGCLKDVVRLVRQEMAYYVDQRRSKHQSGSSHRKTDSYEGGQQQQQQKDDRFMGQPKDDGDVLRSIDHLRVDIPDSSLDDDLARPQERSKIPNGLQQQDHQEALDTLLRTLNNVLLQHANCRLIFAAREQADGLRMALELLSTSTKQAWPPPIVALGARLVFFATLFENEANKWGVEQAGLANVLAGQIERLVSLSASLPLDGLTANTSSKESDDALSEVLKALFNVCLYYPRLSLEGASAKSKASMGDKFHPALLPCLGPTIKALTSLPPRQPCPLAPPLTHAINVLINYPIQQYRHTWIDPSKDPSTSPSISSADPKSKSPKVKKPKSGQKDKERPSTAKRVVTALFGRSSAASNASSSSSSSTGSSNPPPSSFPPTSPLTRVSTSSSILLRKSPPTTSPSQRVTSGDGRARSSSSSNGSKDSSGSASSALAHPPPIVSSTLSLLETFFQRYLSSTKFDDGDAVARAAKDGPDLNLEEVCQPALLLLRKLVAEDAEFRAIVKQRVLPSTIDRTEGLDKRKDFTGQLIRLMSSGTFPQLALLAGETLLALCDDNVEKMSTEIGYGPCAGFFTATGRAAALPSSSSNNGTSSTSGQPIDPITGKVMPSAEEIARQDKESGWSELTEEEKEAEAEKLFGLFDRMDRTGVVKTANPLRQAQESGKMNELDEKMERERQAQDEQDEREAEREMKLYKQRQARGGGPSS